MVYKDKKRDLKRSPLPSKSRKSAREDKRLARKASRSHAKRFLHAARTIGAPEAADKFNPTWDNTEQTRRAVRNRRDADNLSALYRWAENLRDTHPELPADALIAEVRKVIGHSYMADHALSHIVRLEGFEVNPTKYSWLSKYSYRSKQNPDKDISRIVKFLENRWLEGRTKPIKSVSGQITSLKEREGWIRYTRKRAVYIHSYEKPGPGQPNWYNALSRKLSHYEPYDVWILPLLAFDKIESTVREWATCYSTSSIIEIIEDAFKMKV